MISEEEVRWLKRRWWFLIPGMVLTPSGLGIACFNFTVGAIICAVGFVLFVVGSGNPYDPS